MHRFLAFLVLAATACGDAKYRAVEAWKLAPEIRVAGMLSDSRQTARALPGAAPLEVSVADEVDRNQPIEVWMFSYAIADLIEQYPGFAGKNAAEIAAGLQPSFEVGLEAPRAKEVLTTQLIGGGSQDLSYNASTWDTWLEKVTAGGARPLRFDVAPEIACSLFEFEAFQGPAGVRFDGVVMIGDNRAIYSGTSLIPGSEDVQLWLSDGATFTDLGPRANRAPIQGILSWDLTSGSGYGVDDQGRVFRFDEDGATLPVTEHNYLYEACVGRDGVLRGAGSGRVMYELNNSMWRLLDPDRTSPVEFVRSVNRDDLYAYSVCWVSHWDGRSWGGPELFDPQCNTNNGRRTTLQALAAGPDGAVGVGKAAFIAIRNEATGTWVEQHPLELQAANLTAAAVLSRGRIAVGGENGLIAVNQSTRWCPFIDSSAGEIKAMSASPSGNVAYAIGTTVAGAGSRTTILKVTLRER